MHNGHRTSDYSCFWGQDTCYNNVNQCILGYFSWSRLDELHKIVKSHSTCNKSLIGKLNTIDYIYIYIQYRYIYIAPLATAQSLPRPGIFAWLSSGDFPHMPAIIT